MNNHELRAWGNSEYELRKQYQQQYWELHGQIYGPNGFQPQLPAAHQRIQQLEADVQEKEAQLRTSNAERDHYIDRASLYEKEAANLKDKINKLLDRVKQADKVLADSIKEE